ncbi:phosphate/phosphite/phosphonate ABC transporter substrate-binding protein [Paracoccus suum]|uniref:Phosphate/phosphite/phosphonate ABC transporter substrate-binding protein n=2 Tax=Paracoccus suum TaxID=2259340 RepID=A0A344PP28_9RHOB|nr:phosphate/phosphite/phosphonate ABC transporter substrate-binding protein [Paracoccus suum]
MLALAALTTTPALGQDWKADYQVVRFGVLSGENEKDRVQRYDGLKSYLEKTLGVKVELFTAGNYDGVVQALAANQIEFSFLGSSAYAAAWSETKGGVIPLLAAEDADGTSGYYSTIVTRCADDYKNVEDLKGKVLAFADPDSTSGYAVPFYNLVQQGFGDGFFSATPFSGSHEAGVQGVANGTFDAAATYENSDTRGIPQRMVLKGMLKDGVICKIWESPEITNGPFTARANLPEALIDDMRDALETFPTADKAAFDAMVSNEIGGDNPVAGYTRVDHDHYQWIIDMRDWLKEQRRRS